MCESIFPLQNSQVLKMYSVDSLHSTFTLSVKDSKSRMVDDLGRFLKCEWACKSPGEFDKMKILIQ